MRPIKTFLLAVHIEYHYCRLRVGIGNDFPKGQQINWVLGKFDDEDIKILEPKIETACEIIKSFVLTGVDFTMNAFNKKKL